MKITYPFIVISICLFGCENTDFSINSANLPSATEIQVQTNQNLTRNSFGIKAYDPVNFKPTVKCYEGPQFYNFNDWCLYSPTKINQVGVFNRYGTEEEETGSHISGDDLIYDWNFMISLFEEYQGFYNSVENSTREEGKWVIGCISKDDVCGVDSYNNEKCLGVEVAPSNEFSMNNDWFDITNNHCREGKYLKSEDTLGVYGCFITDEYHGHQPEIHPVQQLWFRNRSLSDDKKDSYWLMFLQDASTRFNNWIASPLHGQFLIAFTLPKPSIKSANYNPLTMNLSLADSADLVTSKFGTMKQDCDNGTSHSLVIDGQLMLVVNEPTGAAADNNIGIQFIDLAEKEDGSIIGFVQISLVIGDYDTDEFGRCILGLDVVSPTSKIVKVNIEDIPTKKNN